MKNDYYQDDTVTITAVCDAPYTSLIKDYIITGLDPDTSVFNTMNTVDPATRSQVYTTKEVNNHNTLRRNLETTFLDEVAKIDVDTTLNQRGQRYGEFKTHAQITQDLKEVMRLTDNWERLESFQIEALEMIAHKIGRILNGDPNYDDSWVDIAGYAKLVADRL